MPIDFARLAQQLGVSPEDVELLHRLRGLTQQAIQGLPQKVLQRALRRLDFPDMPRARHAFRVTQVRDDLGRVPHHPLANALRELDSLRLRAPRRSVGGIPTGGAVAPSMLMAVPMTAGLHLNTWIALGPNDVGGRTRSILIHPTDHDTMWAASAGGGIWRTENAGVNWTPVDDFMANLSVTSLVMDPTNSDVVYAGTGEGFGNQDAIRGAGIFITTDGTKWAQLGSTSGPTWETINRLAISADGAVLLAATNAGLHRSADSARATWRTVLNQSVADVKFHPTDPQLAIAGSVSGGNAWHTQDGGLTWRLATHGAPWGRRVEMCYASANPQIVYASVDSANGEIWRSNDGGRSFHKRAALDPAGNPVAFLGDQGWYDNVVWAGDPNDPDLVIVGGIDLWRSTDGGDMLTDISTWYDSRSAHADHHAIVAHPGYDGHSQRTVFFGNDGGVYRTNDITTVGNEPAAPKIAGWTALNNGFAITQFFGAAGHVGTGKIIAGAQDNGTLAYDPAASTWISIFGGDGGFCCSDPNDPDCFYGEYVYLNIHRNTDGAQTDDTAGDRYISGQFWNQVSGRWEWKPSPFRIPDAFNQRALFIAPFVLDPNNSNRILAGGESLWRTDDAKTPNTPTRGPRWTRIKPPAESLISALAVTLGNADKVWVGHERGELWLSLNATAAAPSWSRVTGSGLLRTPARFCHQIFVSPHDADRILVAFGGFSKSNVWLTDDSGATWSDLGSALPAVPIRAVTIHPHNADWFYIGTEVGVFATEDGGASWSPTNEGPANVSVDDLFWMNRTLVCVTHGRGLFQIGL
jgi:hypothetical protein